MDHTICRRNNSSKSNKKRCLSQLQEPNILPLFQEAKQDLPDFIQQNQMGGNKNIRIFKNDNQAHIKIFIFHYMEMCYGKNKSAQWNMHLEKIYELLQQPQFQFFLPDQPTSLTDQTHISMKNILSQFLNYLSLGKQSIQISINRYPLVLDILISFFRTLLYLGDICGTYNEYIYPQQIYDFFTSYFEIEIIQQNDCAIRFAQTNIYVYEEDQNQVYMIFDDKYRSKLSYFSVQKSNIEDKSQLSSVNFCISKIQIQDQNNIEIKQEQHQHYHLHHKKHSSNHKRLLTEQSQKLVSIKESLPPQFRFDSYQKDKENINVLEEPKNQQTKKKKVTLEKIEECNTTLNGIFKQSKSIKKLNMIDTTQTFYRPTSAFNESKVEWKHDKSSTQVFSWKNNWSQNSKIQANKFQKTTDCYKPQSKSELLKEKEQFKSGIKNEWKKEAKKNKVKMWINKNITKQYTNSFILKQIPQPHRSNIQFWKSRAREQRKAAKFMQF